MPKPYSTDTSHSSYATVANIYDAVLTLTGFKRGVERFLDRQNFSLPTSPNILDAGCGTGLMSVWLASRFPDARITASDIDPKMLLEMEQIAEREGIDRSRLTIALGDLKTPQRLRPLGAREAISIPDNYFDGVFISGALEHVPLESSVARLSRLLKPNGIFFNLAMRRSPAGAMLGMMYGARPYRIAAMRRACERAGLEDICVIRLSVEDFPANLSRVAIMAKKSRI